MPARSAREWRHASGNVLHDCGRAHVRVEVLSLEARVAAAEVVFRILFGASRVARQKAATEGAERHEPDAELAQQGNDPGSRLRSHSEYSLWSAVIGMYRMRAADRLSPASESPTQRTLPARGPARATAPTDILDRHVGIDAMLIERSIVRCRAAAASRPPLADVLRAAVDAASSAVLDLETRTSSQSPARRDVRATPCPEALRSANGPYTSAVSRNVTPSRWPGESSRSTPPPSAGRTTRHIPMQPRPIAETSRGPRRRFFMTRAYAIRRTCVGEESPTKARWVRGVGCVGSDLRFCLDLGDGRSKV